MSHLKIFTSALCLILILSLFVTPLTHAASKSNLTVSGWIPYWRDSEGIKSAKRNIASLDTVYPFAFTVARDGSINDRAGLTDREWRSFRRVADRNNVEIIPTIMWSDSLNIHSVLSSTTARRAHIEVIAYMVEQGRYAGVDIDYENKSSETINYFSSFLTELKARLGTRVLSCTIEARTPPESLHREVPATIDYANDYTVIAKICDRVVIMAYDQQRADLLQNRVKAGSPYIPVADIDWVRKVVQLALKDIPKEKLVLGIATYGHHYEVTVTPDWYRDYRRIGALNLPDMLDLAKDYRVTPTRNQAGELSFTYLPKNTTVQLSSELIIPKDTPRGNLVAARALAHANKTGEAVTFRIGWFSDAEAIKQKIDLAAELKLRGISLFKIDGEEDKKVWRYLKE